MAGRLKDKREGPRKSELEDAEEGTAYDVIQSLNRAAGERSKRSCSRTSVKSMSAGSTLVRAAVDI